ncbi:MAG: hypothetical protein NC344_05620 [Bacteroidales bacterium]|nr:hypothetical protein [Bacteroidales bacterium]MCM1147298.1 hypothetical protein [Bacteroidales bacterium]MCM1206268.1 hypothetical protein [Bacillota bacterium]
MRQGQGSAGTKVLECIDPNNNKWRVRWNMKPIDGCRDVAYTEENFDHKPTEDEVRALITEWYNKQTEERILSGMVWNEISVWLSTENQMNFKAAYDLAVQTQGSTLPVKFKLGERDGTAIYYTFNTMAEFTDFYTSCVKFIMDCINTGWKEKDSVDWALYS